jgi:PAS domain S-box-containing protein
MAKERDIISDETAYQIPGKSLGILHALSSRLKEMKPALPVLFGVLSLIGLYLTSLYSYLLFHSLAEMFSITIACGIFIVAWNSRRFLDNMYLLFIGIAYLFVAGVDLMHVLSYKGMGVFRGYDANLPTQFWIAGRYAESLSLLIAPFILGRKLKINMMLLCYVAAISLFLGSIFYWKIFPDCFIEGEGLTPFKKISEYIISLILFASIAMLWRKQSEFDEHVLHLLSASIILTICAELAFTFYVHVYGLSNLVGHFLKIISFYLIYKAIIVTGMSKPFDLLFRNLKQSKESLEEDSKELEKQVNVRTNQLNETIYLLKHEIKEHKQAEKELLRISKAFESASDAIGMTDPRGNHIYQNMAFTKLFGYTAKELDSAGGPTVVYVDKSVAKDVFDNIMSGKSWNGEIEMISKSGQKFPALVRADAIKDKTDNIVGLIGIITDITEHKKISKDLLESKKDLQKLAGRLILNQEEELRRLARELHDDLTQQLAVIAIDAGNIIQQFKDLPPSVFSTVSYIKDRLIKVSKDVHNMSRDLHPSILDDLGLVRAVKSECSNFSSRMGIVVMFTPKNVPDTIPNNIALTIYRIIQEGLSNIVNHANAKNAYVFLECNNNSIFLTIRDTGTGFDPAKVKHKAALGIGSMRERARLVNGKFSITSKPGKGTSIEVRIPLKQEKANG